MKSLRVCFAVALATAVLSVARPAAADLITNSANLPPDGVYLTPDNVHARYAGPALEVLLQRPEHRAIVQEAQRHTVGADEIENFPSTLQGTSIIGANLLGIPVGTMLNANAQGPVETIVFGKAGNVTGTFSTEMLSMNLSGATPLGPFMIRESPTLPSLGSTSITPIGGGLFRIDSFFDVFTELSIDGGQTWIPDANGPAHMTLVPEPSTLVLAGLGLLGIAWVRRRR